jgi:hypothetical protein
MSDTPALPPSPPEPVAPPPPSRTGRLLVGILLVLLGIGWLLDVLGVTRFPWDVLLPSALILIGVVLLLTSRSPERHGGLIAAGVVLTVVLVFGSALDIPLGGGVGDHEAHPTTAGAIHDEYRLAVGRQTLDLSDVGPLDLVASEIDRIRASVGIGQLVVILPPDLPVHVQAHAGLGNLQVLDRQASGFDVDLDVQSPPTGSAAPRLELVVSVGLGDVEVRRG